MQKTDNNSRRDFLKKIPIAIVSISALSSLKFKKSNKYSEKKYDSIAKSEADEIIRNDNFHRPKQMDPMPAPDGQINIK